ncbi:hypothetical protein JCM11491_002158 [Sporobolomyces phaffii]
MQAVASASAGPLNPPADRHRRTPSSTAPPSPHHPSFNANPAGSSAPAVRLPPVSIPRDDFLPVNFNPERRQSINSDPFLHAFSATSDPSYLRRPSVDDSSALFGGGFHGLGPPGASSDHAGPGRGQERGGAMMVTGHPHSPRAGVSHAMPPPPLQSFDPHSQYQFGAGFANTAHHPGPVDSHPHQHTQPHSSFPGPTSTYRFGGPPPPTGTSAPLDAPSYFDYSMRRHSLTTNQSPTRYPQQTAGGGGPPSTASTKRKSSNEEDDPVYNDGPYYPSQNRDGSSYASSSMDTNRPPQSKRKTTSFATDKMSGLDLNDPNRRDSYSPGWEDRRGSDESFRSASSQQGYSMFHPAQAQSGPPANPPNPSPHPPFMRPGTHSNYYDDQIGPRGSIARGMYEPEHQNFGRRPSIPGISQLMQGQAQFYPGQPPHSAPPTAHPPPPSPAPRTSGPPQPAVTVSAVSRSSSIPQQPADSQSGPKIFPVGPPPQWPTSVPSSSGRQGSASSLEPSSALKDSPYSRSPELRVSHKLAERKRRKEMAQLFDDLRESLPGEKGVKSSKWEILTKAVEFIGQLKVYNRELQSDNSNLRNHLNLPQSRPPPHELRSDPSVTPHPLQPVPPSNPVHFVEHSHSHHASPRPHPSRTGSHASSHNSSFSIDNGLPGRE